MDKIRCIECDFEEVECEGDTCEHCLNAYEKPEEIEYEDD